jgi:hypothetical protein
VPGSQAAAGVAAGFTDAMIEFAKGFAIWTSPPAITSSTPPAALSSTS